MRKIYLTILAFLSYLFAFSNLSPTTQSKAIDHLKEVNQYWKLQSDSPTEISFQNDHERIRFHLLSLINILKKKENKLFNSVQWKNRITLLNELTSYAVDMHFPINKYHPKRQPYFIDENDNYCAVGYLLKASGYEIIACDIQRTQNYEYIAYIKHPLLPTWALAHGFELSELAWIQPSYSPQNEFQTIGTGTNGEVKKIETYQNKAYFIGDFTLVNNEPCSAIGTYSNGQVGCLLNEIDGVINDLLVINNGNIWIAGAFNHEGNQYPLARLNVQTWVYYSIEQRPFAVGTEVFYGGANTYGLAIESGENQEVWISQNLEDWTLKLTVDGSINTSSNYSSLTFIGGKFNHVMVYHATDSIQEFVTDNLISVNHLNVNMPWYSETWSSHLGAVASEVKSILVVQSIAYIGGVSSNENPILLTRYLNGVLQPLLSVLNQDENGYSSVEDIDIGNDGNLMIAGDLNSVELFGTIPYYGSHLYTYSTFNGVFTAKGMFNSQVNCLGRIGSEIIIGGNFTQNVGATVNRLAKSSSLVNVQEIEEPEVISLFPNPASGNVQLNFTEQQSGTLRISDMAGRVLQEQQINHQKNMTLDVSRWPSQVVLVSVVGADERTLSTQRLIIQ